jgi:hypothetical protein
MPAILHGCRSASGDAPPRQNGISASASPSGLAHARRASRPSSCKPACVAPPAPAGSCPRPVAPPGATDTIPPPKRRSNRKPPTRAAQRLPVRHEPPGSAPQDPARAAGPTWTTPRLSVRRRRGEREGLAAPAGGSSRTMRGGGRGLRGLPGEGPPEGGT